jgi:RNA recognition motif-containing protein
MNIYVGNLNYKVGESTLKKAFGEFGTVDSVKIIMDKVSGRSKGFAFVEMPDDTEAQAAISQLHETDLMGRKLVVNQARAKE